MALAFVGARISEHDWQLRIVHQLDQTEWDWSVASSDVLDWSIGTRNVATLSYLGPGRRRLTKAEIDAIRSLTDLRRIDLKGLHIASELDGLLTNHAALRHLDLSNTDLDDAAVPSLAMLHQLGLIDLTDTKISKTGIRELFKALVDDDTLVLWSAPD
ncbi:hypothetical protein [Lacipirellula limnantheis]|uniref:hypothetical protein n=1 Tax=Lacipirellula limnantheis TaxID=2528024 RepID=UPI0011AA774F|nr:hypothetical protein [Lacipirellula limnantheis]